jgi:hypothetical protein
METIVKRGAVLSFGVSLFLTVSMLGVGCSSGDDTTPPKLDAGKRDTGSARGGSGGKGGSSGSGGRTGSGGTSGRGGSSGSGGMTASGGSSGSGGVTGMGGGPAVDGGLGGSGGGMDGGMGGQVDAGSPVMDAMGDDAIDAPLPGLDTAPEYDVAMGEDAYVPPMLDSGSLDGAMDSEAVDMTPVMLDAEVDSSVDSSTDLLDLDASPDVAADAGSCLQQIINGGYAFAPANPCSQCQASTLQTQCEGMIDCLEASDCPSPGSPNNCWVNCRNAVVGNQIATETCVSALVTAACP